ncbi:hypothetical protein RSOLAG1IB_11852 [Rhizoctonia solani AG-1 IB]|uniref:DUF659 domain-containing protein n=1 Tax=Thanatephorus cucumeris (strain AG1-IB / isolate 7/3/14) TaxID=1108050 RepID=A0A0B7FGX9_THACB|nr:hypothetical protein RSOLAG1IB_11852 [Rhizoctonia solani AG-1 IB]
MSTFQASLSVPTQSGSSSLDPRLYNLYSNLRNLPEDLPDHPEVYPFASNFTLDPDEVEFYGSQQGALNHRLELIFGSRSTGNAIQFRGRGRSLEAIVYVLRKYINGDDRENIILWKWVEDLTSSAAQASPTRTLCEKTAMAESSKAPSRRRSNKRQGNARKPCKRLSEAKIKVAKARSAKRWAHDPADLEDDGPNEIDEGGRTPDEFLDQLTISCHSKIDKSHRRFRCVGTGCWWSWAKPRPTARIIKHARWCDGIDPELQEEVQRRGASLSLAFKMMQRHDSNDTLAYTITPPNPDALRQKEERVNHALLKLICDRMIPPVVVDCLRWREFVASLDENVNTASGSTISDNFVTTEAEYIREESRKLLSQNEHLTLSYDGGTTRGHESVYTVHVTIPSSRDALLMDGNEASGVSHTAEHICTVLDKTLKAVGPEKFSCIVSDNAGNTRVAREMIEEEYPWIISLQDACHHQSNTAKDIGQLQYFQWCASKMKSIITHFHSSTYAARHLAALCVLHNILEGIIAVGNTRFASYFYAARLVLNCLPLILQLISLGVLDMNSASPIYWMLDGASVERFTKELRQLCTILEPFARSIKCLESIHSTLANVYLFWIAIISRIHELFKYNLTINGVGLPVSVMEDVTSIINGRHQEMFQKLSGPVYLAAFFLDVRFQNSDVFLGYKQNFAHVHRAHTDLSSDSDLCHLLPAYTLSGGYLIKLLGRLYNKNPNAPPFLHYSSWPDVKTSFHRQLIRFTRGASPFDKRYDDAQSARQYWENLILVPSADLLALVGLLLSSIVPNSMAEERTMSTITKLNSPDRASQKVGTLIDMTTIRQYYKREEALKSPVVICTATPHPPDRPTNLPQNRQTRGLVHRI